MFLTSIRWVFNPSRAAMLLPQPPRPALTEQHYEQTVWPTLESGVERLLEANAEPQSLEVLHRAVHNACCCGMAQRVETDLLSFITRHASAIARRLPLRGDGLADLHEILGPVCTVFAYLDREYLSGRLEPRMTQLVLQQMHASPPVAPFATAAPPSAPPTAAVPASNAGAEAPSSSARRSLRNSEGRTDESANKRLRSDSGPAIAQ